MKGAKGCSDLGVEHQQNLHIYVASYLLVQEIHIDSSFWCSFHILWKTDNSPGWLYIIWPQEVPEINKWNALSAVPFFVWCYSDQRQKQVKDNTWINYQVQCVKFDVRQTAAVVKTPTLSAAFSSVEKHSAVKKMLLDVSKVDTLAP